MNDKATASFAAAVARYREATSSTEEEGMRKFVDQVKSIGFTDEMAEKLTAALEHCFEFAPRPLLVNEFEFEHRRPSNVLKHAPQPRSRGAQWKREQRS